MNIDEYYEKSQKLSKQEVEKLIEANETLRAHIDHILEKLRFDKDAPYDSEDCRVEIDCLGIRLYWDKTTGCCGHYETEEQTYFIPLHYLWDNVDDIIANKKALFEEEEKEKQRKEAEKKAQQAAERERRDYEKFIELQKRFGESS